jgi:GAF domain-containing protein/CheY-like chemotaxis protein
MEKTNRPRQAHGQDLSAWKNFQNLIETVSSSLSLREVIQRLANGVVKDLSYPACYVNLYHPEEDSLSIAGFAPRGKLLQAAEKILGLRVDEIRFPLKAVPIYGRIFQGEEFVVNEYSELVSPLIPSPVAHASQKIFGIRSILVSPLQSKQDLIGVFLVGNSDGDFSPEERETLRSVSRHAAIAIEKALLHEALDGAKREAEAMAEISQDLSSSLDLRRILRKIVRHARVLCQADLCAFALCDKDSGSATITEVEGARTQVYKNMKIYPGKGIGGKVLETGRIWVTDDFLHDPRLSGDYHREAILEGIRSNMAVPILTQQEIAGILWVANRSSSPFKPLHQRVLQKLSIHAGIAMLNARLYEESKEALHRQRSLMEIVAAINASLNQEEILATISRFATEFCHADACAIFGVAEEGHLFLQGGHNLSTDFPKALEEARILPGEIGASRVTISSIPVEVFDPWKKGELPSHVSAVLKKEGLRSYITMALTREGKEIGGLTVFRHRLQHYSTEQLDLLNTLTQHAAVSLERNLLYGEMEARTIRLSVLSDIAKSIGGPLESEEIFRFMLAKVERVVPFQVAFLYTFQEQRDSFTAQPLCQESPVPEPLDQREIPSSETPASIAFFGKKTFMIENIQESDLSILQEVACLNSWGIHSMLYIPILEEDRCQVILGFGSSVASAYSTDQIELLSDLSPYLALALKNASLFSELKSTLQELESAQKKILQAEKLKALGEMASGIAHDFNNLLATILVQAELCERRSGDPELQEWTRIIQRTALDGAETVRRLRSFYKQEADSETMTLDLNQIIEEVIHRTEPRWKDQAQSGGVFIELERDLQPLPPIMGNPSELRDVFTNLLFNAIDALPRGGKISISTRLRNKSLSGELVEVSLTDTGIGMSKDILERAFDPFFTTKGARGSGLGLSLSYGIIKRHQGEITLHSAPNLGTSVLLRFPSTHEFRGVEKSPLPGIDLPPKRILIIEDEKELAEGLQRMLSLFGHQVDVAFGGKEGICQFTGAGYDLVFTDMGLPDLSGIDVAKVIKEIRPLVPIILITGWGEHMDLSQVKDAGVDSVLSKPFRLVELLQAIREAKIDSP